VRRPTQRPFSAGDTGIDCGALEEHLQGQNPERSIQTLLKEALCGCPALIDEALKGLRRQSGPEVSAHRPLLLKIRAKGGLVKPEKAHICRIVPGMLGTSNALQVLIVQPVHIRMRIARVTGSAIDLTTVHGPEV
jgi:hypothetical protein